MRWITHIAIAALFIKLVEISLLIDLSSYYLWPVIILYAVMPDFDSLLGIKHRTYTHTLYAPFIAALPLLFFQPAFIAALTAYLSHIFADMLTPAGLPLFYPKSTAYHLLPAALANKDGEWWRADFAIRSPSPLHIIHNGSLNNRAGQNFPLSQEQRYLG